MRLSTNSVQQIGINSILEQQAQLSHTQQQLATGQKILTPADNPVASTLALGLDQIKTNNDQYTQNGTYAQNSLQLESTTLSSVQNNLQRIRELVVNGLNGTMSTSDRQNIATELNQRFQELQSLANTTDGAGNYIFAGGTTNTAPYSGNLSSGVSYNGGQSQQYLQISGERQIATNDPGSDVFGGVPVVTASPGSGNTGNATISDVSASSKPLGGTKGYTGQLTLTYNSASKTFSATLSGSSKSVSSVSYDSSSGGGTVKLSDGSTVGFAIKGTPANGDTMTISDAKQSAFTIVGKAVTDMQNGAPDSLSLDQIDALMNRISDVQAKVGGRLNAITDQQNINSDYNLQLTQTKSSLTDLDYASAVGKMNTQMTGLQAAMKSYTQVQGLSLFNYL